MLLAVVCLWIGFAVGFVCAALLARGAGIRETNAREDRREMRGGFSVERRRLPRRADSERSAVGAASPGEEE